MIPVLAALLFGTPALWHDPGQVETIDFSRPARNSPAPSPPFTFLEEDKSGTSAKVLVRDSASQQWQVKGGREARADAFATRVAAAVGYYADSIHFLQSGRLEDVPGKLWRASGFVRADGTWGWASFEWRDPAARFLPDGAWHWQDNAFAGTRELKGLKLLVMLLSNWDNKDSRDSSRGSNTGSIESGGRTWLYVNDWGQSLGATPRFRLRSNWNCEDFSRQNPGFVTLSGGTLRFGYTGQHTNDFTAGIEVEDVRWFMQYVGRITDAQLRIGLLTSGASAEEERCFSHAIRERIEALRRIAAGPAAIR